MSELAEGARLEIVCTPKKVYRGFESLSLRHLYFHRPRLKSPVADASSIDRFEL